MLARRRGSGYIKRGASEVEQDGILGSAQDDSCGFVIRAVVFVALVESPKYSHCMTRDSEIFGEG